MRSFLFSIITATFVLCGFIDAAHADICQIETEKSLDQTSWSLNSAWSEFDDDSAEWPLEEDSQDEHSCAHHHHHGTVEAVNFQDSEANLRRLLWSHDEALDPLAWLISKPPIS